jgi:AcrR family transcriptional regulator
MSVRKTVNRQSICDAAVSIIKAEGIDSFSMRTLAASLGIRAPSLYDHVKNREEVIALVQAVGLLDFGDGFRNAGPTVRDKILFYRQWALTNPNLYPVVFQQRLHRELLPEGLEEKVLGLVIVAAGGSHVQARAMWAQLHGLVDLELQGRLPADADMKATWEQVIVGIEAIQKAHLA